MLERVERHAPGISDAVEFTDIATPYTFWRYARSYRGSYEGFYPTQENMGQAPVEDPAGTPTAFTWPGSGSSLAAGYRRRSTRVARPCS